MREFTNKCVTPTIRFLESVMFYPMNMHARTFEHMCIVQRIRGTRPNEHVKIDKAKIFVWKKQAERGKQENKSGTLKILHDRKKLLQKPKGGTRKNRRESEK